MSTLRQLIEARIRTQVPIFKEVAGAADLSSILTGRVSAPGCYIFTERDKVEARALASGVNQRVVESMAVVTVVRNVRDARGTDADDENKHLRDLVGNALVSWIPDSGHAPMEYGGGQLISFSNGFLFYKSTYLVPTLSAAVFRRASYSGVTRQPFK
jgi:hypothetical protein